MPLVLPDALLPTYFTLTRANRILRSPEVARRTVTQRALRPQPFAPPRLLPGLLRRDVTLAVEQRRGWPVYRIAPKQRPARGGLIYAHGGAWVGQIVTQHWQLCAQLAAEAGVTVTVPIYPLVPFGTAQEVVSGVAELARESAKRFGPTALGGDSAGGQIVLSAALLLGEQGVVVPRTLLIAPALDLSFSNPEIPVVQRRDPWLAVEGTKVYVEHWRGDLAVSDPLVSPLNGELRGLGPLSIFIGGRDICLPDNRLLRGKAMAAGVHVDYYEEPEQLHVYPLLPTRAGAAGRQTMVEQLRGLVG